MDQPKRKVHCPRCGTKQAHRGPDAIYRCPKCGGMFDDSPDEGGTFSSFNPAARMEREERNRERKHGGRR